MNIATVQFNGTMHCQVSPLSYTSKSKNYFALNLVFTHSLNFFIITKIISHCHHSASESFCVVNSAGGSLCWNYANDTFYSKNAVANACCNYADFEVLLQLCWWCFLLHLCWRIVLLQL